MNFGTFCKAALARFQAAERRQFEPSPVSDSNSSSDSVDELFGSESDPTDAVDVAAAPGGLAA